MTLNQLERTATHVIWDTDTGNQLTLLDDATGTTRALTPRGIGPLALVGNDLIFQDSLVSQISVCTLPVCASVKTLATKTTAVSIAADQQAVFWTVPTEGVVMGVAR